MTTHKGFALLTALIIIAGLLVLGGGAYVSMNPGLIHQQAQTPTATTDVQTAPGDHPEVDHSATDGMQVDVNISAKGGGASTGKPRLLWKLEAAGEKDNIPYTKVTAVVNGTAHVMGTFQGSCKEVTTANAGIDGKGLLAGEQSAVQCWFAGGGDEIGAFANEDGGIDLMVGSLSEPDGEGAVGTRGNFKVKFAL